MDYGHRIMAHYQAGERREAEQLCRQIAKRLTDLLQGGPRAIPWAVVDGVSHIVEYLMVNEVEELTPQVVQQVNNHLLYRTRVGPLFRNNFGEDNFAGAVRTIHEVMYETPVLPYKEEPL